jgi:hypothetical protein
VLSIHLYFYSLCKTVLLYACTCLLYFLLRFFLLTVSISYFGLYVPLLSILDINKFSSIQNYPCAHHEGKQSQHNTFPHILYLGTTQGHCSPPSPSHLTPSTHHLGSCKHSRANLESFKIGKHF